MAQSLARSSRQWVVIHATVMPLWRIFGYTEATRGPGTFERAAALVESIARTVHGKQARMVVRVKTSLGIYAG